MPIEVEGPDGVVIEFPDDTPPDTIKGVMAKRYPVEKPSGKRGQTSWNGLTAEYDVPEGATDEQLQQASYDALTKAHPGKKIPPPRAFRVQRPDNSVMGSIKDTATNIARAAGALPDLLAQAGGALMNGLGNVGAFIATGGGANKAPNALAVADSMRQWGNQQANGSTISGELEKLNPGASERPGALMDQMFGGMLVPIGPKAAKVPARNALAPSAQQGVRGVDPLAPVVSGATRTAMGRDIVEQGKRAGGRTLTSDVLPPKTFMGKAVQSIGERVPLLGTGGVRAAQQAERIESVRNVAREYGAAIGDDMASPAIDDVMADFAKTRGAEVARHAKAKKAIVEGIPGEVSTPHTAAALDEQIAKFSTVDTPAAKTLVGKLQGWKESLVVAGGAEKTGILDASGNSITRAVAPQGKGLSTIDLIRAEMGEAFKDPSLASIKTAGEKALQSIYGPMKTDMAAFIKTNGGPEKLAQWQKANLALSGMADELNVSTLRGVLRSGKGTPEDIGKLLFSNKPSLVRRLYNNLSDEGRARAETALFQRVLEKSGGMAETSPEKFLTQIKTLGRGLGVFIPEHGMARLDGLTRWLNSTRRAGQAGVATNSGQQAIPFLVGGAAVSHPWLVGGGALLARAYESAPVRDAFLKLGRTKAGSPQEVIQMNRVIGMIAPMIERAKPALNDNVGVAAAASDSEENQQK